MKRAIWMFSMPLLALSLNIKAQVASVSRPDELSGTACEAGRKHRCPTVSHQITFSLWNAPTGGAAQWSQTFNAVSVREGAFAALLNVGTGPANLFSANLYLQIQVDGAAPLLPRQPLASVAYAFKANSVADGSINTAQLVPGSVTAATLAPGLLNGMNNGWSLLGNSGTNPAVNYLGTTDNQPLLFRTNGLRGLGLYPTNSANGSIFRGTNILGGYENNYFETGVAGATISGGGYFDTSIGGSYPNAAYDNFCVIAGGGSQ